MNVYWDKSRVKYVHLTCEHKKCSPISICMFLYYIRQLSHAATCSFICFLSAVSVAESKMVRVALVTATSLALTGAVVAHAYFLKHQFYPTVVYLTKSSPSMAVSPKQIVGFGLNDLNVSLKQLKCNFVLSGIRCFTFRHLCWCFCWESS